MKRFTSILVIAIMSSITSTPAVFANHSQHPQHQVKDPNFGNKYNQNQDNRRQQAAGDSDNPFQNKYGNRSPDAWPQGGGAGWGGGGGGSGETHYLDPNKNHKPPAPKGARW